MLLTLERQVFAEDYTLGELFVEGTTLSGRAAHGHFAWTCEDRDRALELDPKAKVWGATAIPLGTYELRRAWSPRFRREVLQLLDVPGFERVYLHGGNSAADSHGCPLVGRERTATGVQGARGVNLWLMREVADGSTIEIRRTAGALRAGERAVPVGLPVAR